MPSLSKNAEAEDSSSCFWHCRDPSASSICISSGSPVQTNQWDVVVGELSASCVRSTFVGNDNVTDVTKGEAYGAEFC